MLGIHLLPNARLFTADAVSMYTTIPTHMALILIGNYITQYQQKLNGDYPPPRGPGRPMPNHDPEHLHFRGPYLQTTKWYCNGHATHTTICHHELWNP